MTKKTFHDLTFKWFLIGCLFQPLFLNDIKHIFHLTGLQELNMTTFRWHFYKQTTKWKTCPSFLPLKRNLWTQFVICAKRDLSISAGQGEHPWFSGFLIFRLKKILWHYESENLHKCPYVHCLIITIPISAMHSKKMMCALKRPGRQIFEIFTWTIVT